MKEFSYTVTDNEGIHARPAGLLVKRMKTFGCNVHIQRGDDMADLKKLFALMGLGVRQGESVTVRAEGDDEDACIESAKTFFEENL